MATFGPSLPGIFIFGRISGICPCNSVLYLGLTGYRSSGKIQVHARINQEIIGIFHTDGHLMGHNLIFLRDTGVPFLDPLFIMGANLVRAGSFPDSKCFCCPS